MKVWKWKVSPRWSVWLRIMAFVAIGVVSYIIGGIFKLLGIYPEMRENIVLFGEEVFTPEWLAMSLFGIFMILFASFAVVLIWILCGIVTKFLFKIERVGDSK